MMLSLWVGNTEYPLDDGTYCYYAGDDGLGMAPVHRLSDRAPQQHGDADRGYLLDPRFFRLYLDIEASSYINLWERRQELMRLFMPSLYLLTLRWTIDTDFVRQIDCVYVGEFGMPSADRNAFAQRVVVGLKAPYPPFYDPEAEATTFQLGAGAGSDMAVPTDVPTQIGGSTINITQAVMYEGNVDSFPALIRITGPITNPVITNVSLDLKLDITGTTIAGGDYYDIDLRYGQKTVVDAGGANRIGNLTSDSDLAEWRIAADVGSIAIGYPEGKPNSIRVQGSSCTGSTKVEITYFNQYIGI